ncbi:aspartate/glutamate racemase family protein [Micromonospora sp. WMMD975]|uniref:aspartate/glutamate racemase family protein n=1 Tax=Micromonospora sp. WMMD975 TaxID=3016087 RepID=UPI00249AA37A|nr:aspartate/glutamate racemase family protein [Micromonospora sp. WMMD975]WFE35277.1 aspartate/glutamate racemase family protein [Micromonospora sp. WMMD975]
MSDRPEIGVLCLDTSFDKIPGHIRNPATFDFPVRYRVVEGATPQRLVREADPTLLEPFVAAARDLQAAGVAGITGACGFLVLFQAELAAAVDVPLWSSSLVQVPMVHLMVGRTVGLLVADEAALTPRHLAAVGAADVPVAVTGMAGQPEFREVMLQGRRDALDVDRLAAEVDGRVDGLARAHPDLGALVIECTDLVPFAHRIQARLGVPVFDIVTLTTMAHATLTRRPYAGSR